MIIDFHTHIIPPHIKENRSKYAQLDTAFEAIYSNPKAKLATADELIDAMDKDGVDMSVVLNYGWTTQELCIEVNDYIIESVHRYPGRLVGFCSIQPESIDNAICETERCAEAGIRGVGEIRPDVQLFDFNHPELMKPLVEVVQAKNLILLTHASEPVGHHYPGKGKATPELLYNFIKAYPDVKMVCAHWGGGLPFFALMPEVREAFNNVYFDTAASPFLYDPRIYRQVIKLTGADKILFGSDYPLIPQRRYLKEIASIDLSQEHKDNILYGNAAKLLGIAEK